MNTTSMIQDPGTVLSGILGSLPDLTTTIHALFDPIRERRDAIRAFFLERGQIVTLPTGVSAHQVGCTDGAYIVSPLAVGDHISTLAVAVAQRDLGNSTGVVASRAWSDFQAHSGDAEVLAKATMMAHELELLTALPDDSVKIIDGSYVTPLIAISLALSSAEDNVRAEAIRLASSPALLAAITHVSENPLVVACPKSDSAAGLWSECAEELDMGPRGLPDKALTTLILDEGEVLVSDRPTPSWAHLYSTAGRISDPAAVAAGQQLSEVIAPLRQERVKVHHAKPYGSRTSLRIETHAGLDDFQWPEVVQSICQTVYGPNIQEPFSQHIADRFAKQVSIGAHVQKQSLHYDLIEQGATELASYLTLPYRTTV